VNKQEIDLWRSAQLQNSHFQVHAATLSDGVEWSQRDGRIVHESGGFFSIVGLRFKANDGSNDWLEQPFILQPEVGILGFLLGDRDGSKSLLVQAKTEPGNPGGVQLAPTFQCTESNYLCRHGGRRAPFFEHFSSPLPNQVVVDSKQSEQGTRFYDKFNRNVMLMVEPDEIGLAGEVFAAWRWIAVQDSCRLITEDFVFNTDARSVLASCDWNFLCDDGGPFERWSLGAGFGRDLWESCCDDPTQDRIESILDWLRSFGNPARSDVEIVPIEQLASWTISPMGILSAEQDTTVAVHYYEVRALDREVPTWFQPLVTSSTPGLVPLFAQRREGVLRFLVRVVWEPGFPGSGQVSVPFQVHPGNLDSNTTGDLAALAALSEQLLDCRMSEEGGRFFREWNRYQLFLIPEGCDTPGLLGVEWLTLGEINVLKRRPGIFTNEFRSVLSLLLHYL
jgi:oxidase EvaA